MSVIGLEAHTYVNMGTETTPDWQEVPCIRDQTLNQDSSVADGSSRCSGGFRSQRSALREITVDLVYVHHRGGDTHGWDIFTGDYFADPRVNRQYLFLTGDGSAAGGASEGLQGYFEIQTFNVNMQLEDVVTADVTLLNNVPWITNQAVLPQWVVSPITGITAAAPPAPTTRAAPPNPAGAN